MNRYWIITVFKNAQGAIDYDKGYEESENYIEFLMEEEEFSDHIDKQIFDAINEECNLLIDNYESEIIPADCISTCILLCNTLRVKENTMFYKALIEAEKRGFGLALDF